MSQPIPSDEVRQCNFEPPDDILQEINAYDDCSNKGNDHKILLTDEAIPWKISIYPPQGRNLERLVAWQIERHVLWLDENDNYENEDLDKCRYSDKKNFCSTFRIRTAKDLRKGMPFDDGNLGLPSERGRHFEGTMSDDGLGYQPWGQPAAALLQAARSHCNNPEDWMLLDEPRKLLIEMERWCQWGKSKNDIQCENASDWTDLRKSKEEEWNQAFSVCGCGKGKRCRKSRGEIERTD